MSAGARTSAAAQAGGAPPSRRLFFALVPGAAARAALHALARAHAGRARIVPAVDLHLTLLFLGQVGEAALPGLRAAAVALRAAPCTVMIERLERWRGGLLCATAPATKPLRTLRAQLLAALRDLGLHVDARPLRAHVTLARGVARVPVANTLGMAPVRWRSRSFCLMESRPGSNGGRYSVVGRWPLDSAPDAVMQHESRRTGT
jgi:2'-5' RNA ligase